MSPTCRQGYREELFLLVRAGMESKEYFCKPDNACIEKDDAYRMIYTQHTIKHIKSKDAFKINKYEN